jgi:hypothetical protein
MWLFDAYLPKITNPSTGGQWSGTTGDDTSTSGQWSGTTGDDSTPAISSTTSSQGNSIAFLSTDDAVIVEDAPITIIQEDPINTDPLGNNGTQISEIPMAQMTEMSTNTTSPEASENPIIIEHAESPIIESISMPEIDATEMNTHQNSEGWLLENLFSKSSDIPIQSADETQSISNWTVSTEIPTSITSEESTAIPVPTESIVWESVIPAISSQTESTSLVEKNGDTSSARTGFHHPKEFIIASIEKMSLMMDELTRSHDEKIREAEEYEQQKITFAEKEQQSRTDAEDFIHERTHAERIKKYFEEELESIEKKTT